MRKRLFLKNALILTGSSLLLSGLSMVFRVYQTNHIGAEGMGLMQLLLSVYYFATNLAVSGFNLAVTRLVTEAEVHKQSVPAILRRCFSLCITTGVISGTLLFLFAPLLGGNLLGDSRTVLPLQILALSLPMLSLSCCCRGYFLATRNALKPCLGQLCEQFCSFGFSGLFLPHTAHNLTTACCILATGIALGELAGCVVISAFLRQDLRKATHTPDTSRHIPLRSVLSIALPIALGYDLRSALIAVENLLIPAGLKQCGSSYAQSLAAYGIVKGIALPTIQFPSAFLTAFSLLLIPEVSQSRAAGHPAAIRNMANRVFSICLRFSLPVTCMFAFFGPSVGVWLYQNSEAGRMLRLLCPLVPFMYLDSIVDAMLKGMDEQMYSLKVNLSDSCLRIVLMVLLLPRLGIYGYLTAMYISILYNALLSIGRFLKSGRMAVHWKDWLFVPGLCAGLSCLCGRFLLYRVAELSLRCIGMIALSALLYVILLLCCAGTSKERAVMIHSTPG